jgi:hypothetical protein
MPGFANSGKSAATGALCRRKKGRIAPAFFAF